MEEQKKMKKRVPLLPVILAVLLVIAAGIYGAGRYYYQERFLPGTVIDRIDVSGMTIEELKQQIPDYMLTILERQKDGTVLEEDILGRTIDLQYSSEEPLKEILEGQNKWLWFLRQESSYEMENLLTYDKQALEEAIQGLKGFEEGFWEAPTDAYIAEYDETKGFEVVAETAGNQLNLSKTREAIRQAIEGLAERISLEEAGCYEVPAVVSTDEEITGTLEKLKKYSDIRITYTFGDNLEVLESATICGWLKIDGTEVTLDQSKVEEYVATLRKRYDTIFRPRTFLTSYGKEVTIDQGDYGWWMNYGQEAVELAEMIENGESGERTPVYYQTAASYGTPDYGNTYVEVNLTAQHLYLYVDGERILESDFVSGNSSRGYDTPAGVYGITYKQRNATLTGENYATPVSYWMPFNGNIGLHDANWRSSFGGNIYKTSGSHGCINLPPSVAKELYENIEKGTPVICYHLPGTEAVQKEPETVQPETSEESAAVPEPTAPEPEAEAGQ